MYASTNPVRPIYYVIQYNNTNLPLNNVNTNTQSQIVNLNSTSTQNGRIVLPHPIQQINQTQSEGTTPQVCILNQNQTGGSGLQTRISGSGVPQTDFYSIRYANQAHLRIILPKSQACLTKEHENVTVQPKIEPEAKSTSETEDNELETRVEPFLFNTKRASPKPDRNTENEANKTKLLKKCRIITVPIVKEGEEDKPMEIETRDLELNELAPGFYREKEFKCGFCKKVFSRKASLQVHETTKHTEGSKVETENEAAHRFVCKICSKSFGSRLSYSTHLKVHDNTPWIKCDLCSKEFRQKIQYVLHRKIHTGEKDYCCETCGKSFTRKSVLKIHMESHVVKGVFLCSKCPKTFSSMMLLEEHIENHSEET